jgi:hypothetical protein
VDRAGRLDLSQAVSFGLIALLSGLVLAPTLVRRGWQGRVERRAVHAS